jgi:hypothetical protein
MLSIQEGAKEIYSDNPRSVYFFTGPEYGVKKQYINQLASNYDSQIEERSTFSEIIEALSKKSLIPRPNKVYIVRYDKEFISKLDDRIVNINIPGTVVGLYEDDADEARLDKKFPNNTLRLNKLTPAVAAKHLTKEFEVLPSTVIESIVSISKDFYSAQIVCQSLSNLPKDIIHSISRSELESLFGYQTEHTTLTFKEAIADRNFKSAVKEIEAFDGDLSLLIYDILSTFLEIIKVLEKPYTESFVKPYMKKWSADSVKLMYDVTYSQLKMLRNFSTYSPYISLMYICSLLKFQVG